MCQHTAGNHRRCFVALRGMEPFDGFSLRLAFEQVVNETKTFLEFLSGKKNVAHGATISLRRLYSGCLPLAGRRQNT
jgi:hypothetical protein